MSGGLLVGDEPLLTSLSLNPISISECLFSLQEQCSHVVDDLADDLLNEDLIDARDVETDVTDKPLLSSVTLSTLRISGLTRGTHFDSFTCFDRVWTVLGYYLRFNPRNVDFGSEFEPLITSDMLNDGIFTTLLASRDHLNKVTESLQFEGLVARNHWQFLLLG